MHKYAEGYQNKAPTPQVMAIYGVVLNHAVMSVYTVDYWLIVKVTSVKQNHFSSTHPSVPNPI